MFLRRRTCFVSAVHKMKIREEKSGSQWWEKGGRRRDGEGGGKWNILLMCRLESKLRVSE